MTGEARIISLELSKNSHAVIKKKLIKDFLGCHCSLKSEFCLALLYKSRFHLVHPWAHVSHDGFKYVCRYA